MKHHYGDFLDRNGDYWTVVPNRERHAYSVGDVPQGSQEIIVVTISKDDENWERIFTFPNLEEVTLHEPSKVQLEKISQLTNIKRLRITHARPKDITFLSPLVNVEELVMEYVSGFSDLSPLRAMKKLKSLHLENLRRVADFSGLSGIESLRFLRIDGTLDWKQPIADFEFLKGLPNLEVLSFGQVINKTLFPALLPVLSLNKLKKISFPYTMFDAKEYALLSVGLKNIEGNDWKPYYKIAYSSVPLPKDDVRYHLPDDVIKKNHPDVRISHTGERLINNPNEEWIDSIGKKVGMIKCDSARYIEKCTQYTQLFESMKDEARSIIEQHLNA
ncbi:MAG: hypothetical protein WBP13_10765 [Methylophilaceae bacterium]